MGRLDPGEIWENGVRMSRILKYPGSKWNISEQIVPLIPEHKSYVEPFFGSGAVFFTKAPSPIETINDLDHDVTNLFWCIREDPERIAWMVQATPYSREIYDDACEREESNGDFEKALNFLTRCWQGYGYRTSTEKDGWKNDVQGRERAYAVRDWNRLPDRVIWAAERLKQAQIENRPALEIIRRFNCGKVFMYLDPPYVISSRKRGKKQYRKEMTDEDHEKMLKELVNSKAKIMISGYETEMYNDYLHNWAKSTFDSWTERGKPTKEIVWMNYQVNEQLELRFF